MHAPQPDHPTGIAEPSIAELIAARPHLTMHAMDGLVMDGVPLARVADALGTPVWVYSAGAIRARYRALAGALDGLGAHIHYAVKANDHLAVLRVFAAEGAGADVVSGGELLRALAAGIAPGRDRLLRRGQERRRAAPRAGSGRSARSTSRAPRSWTCSLAIAASMGRTARIALRVNPDVEAGTHAKISTGRARDKFGIPYGDAAALYARAAGLPGIAPVGLAVHIGSQILSVAPYRAAFARLAELVRGLRAAGRSVETVDCGGGLGIGYRDEPTASPAALAGAIARDARRARPQAGGRARALAGRAGRASCWRPWCW